MNAVNLLGWCLRKLSFLWALVVWFDKAIFHLSLLIHFLTCHTFSSLLNRVVELTILLRDKILQVLWLSVLIASNDLILFNFVLGYLFSKLERPSSKKISNKLIRSHLKNFSNYSPALLTNDFSFTSVELVFAALLASEQDWNWQSEPLMADDEWWKECWRCRCWIPWRGFDSSHQSSFLDSKEEPSQRTWSSQVFPHQDSNLLPRLLLQLIGKYLEWTHSLVRFWLGLELMCKRRKRLGIACMGLKS